MGRLLTKVECASGKTSGSHLRVQCVCCCLLCCSVVGLKGGLHLFIFLPELVWSSVFSFFLLLQYIGDGKLDDPQEFCFGTKILYAPVTIHSNPYEEESRSLECAWVIHNAYEIYYNSVAVRGQSFSIFCFFCFFFHRNLKCFFFF